MTVTETATFLPFGQVSVFAPRVRAEVFFAMRSVSVRSLRSAAIAMV
jgi:hypothetical protein